MSKFQPKGTKDTPLRVAIPQTLLHMTLKNEWVLCKEMSCIIHKQ